MPACGSYQSRGAGGYVWFVKLTIQLEPGFKEIYQSSLVGNRPSLRKLYS